ncbi:MAG TPA: putative Ig domain-containing protein [Candidatus Dormibacteraeota bacterium]
MAALVLIVSGCTDPQNQSSGSPSPSALESPSASPVALAITSPRFHAGEVGVAYATVTPGASGGAAPYTWTVSAGKLPAGLAIGSDGTVSGKPTRAGSFHFTLQVADSAGAKVGLVRSVAIAPALKLTLIPACATHCTVEIGCVNVCGRFGTATGGRPPYRYALTQGYVPTGTSQSGLSLTGTFAGSPSRWQFTVAVTDALGVTKTITANFFVYPHISVSNGTCSVTALTCTVQLWYLGSIPGELPTVKPTSWSTTDCIYTRVPAVCLPQPALTATVQPGLVTLTLTVSQGWPTYTGTLKLLITDKDLCGAGKYCSAKATVTVA